MNKNIHKFSVDAINTIQQHLESVYPNEGCGFFFGKDGEIRSTTIATPVPNVKKGDQRRRFEINPLDYMKAERFALENDLDLLGIYHSHPDHPAIPSEHDLKQAVTFFSYLIASVKEGKVAKITSWRLTEAEVPSFEEETISNFINHQLPLKTKHHV